MSHLKEVNEGYIEHMVCAQKYGFRMIGAGFACIIHSLFPNLFITTASDVMRSIIKEIDQRKENGHSL